MNISPISETYFSRKISRGTFRGLLLGGLVAAGLVNAAEAEVAGRPNIVFIMADDFALEAISSYGSWLKDYAKTPNIDRIAREGMLFRNVFCNNSICSPSRASILTGQYSHKNGVRELNGQINANSPLFPVELKKAGYQTALFGKWHLENTPEGFDDYLVLPGQGKYFDPDFVGVAGKRNLPGYATDIITDLSLEWLKKRDPAKPFCLLIHHKAPHGPFSYPERLAGLYEGVQIPEPFNLHEDVWAAGSLIKPKQYTFIHDARGPKSISQTKLGSTPAGAVAPEEGDEKARRSQVYQAFIKSYIRCITAVDENVGRVLEALDREKLSENTLVVFTSDQGFWLGQHGFSDKRLILEESIKMPLLVRYPREIAAGATCQRLAANVDFAPTFLDYAGAPVPKAMQGRSLRPLLQGKTPADWRTSVFYAYWTREPFHWGIRTDRHTYIRVPDSEEVEIYDIVNDPHQMKNEAGNPAFAAIIKQSETELAKAMQEVDIRPEELPKAKVGAASGSEQ